jgi:hypothetical protein
VRAGGEDHGYPLGGVLVEVIHFDTTGIHDPFMGWVPRTFVFVAPSAAQTRLEFDSFSPATAGL